MNLKRIRGQALVELALVLPILLLALFSFIESARIFQAFLVVQDAAREAARYAVTGLPSEDECAFKGYFDEGYTDEKYIQCRVDTIKATARTHVVGLPVDPNETNPGRPGYLGVEVRGKPCWSVSCPAQLDHPGIPGTRVSVRVYFNLPLAVFTRSIPAIQLQGTTEMVNEGFQVGFGSEAPPLLESPEPPPPLDTDGDLLCDSEERNLYGTDPILADTDGDLLSDGSEVGDTTCNGAAVTPASDPLDPCNPNPIVCTVTPEPPDTPTPTATIPPPTPTPLAITIFEPLLEGSTYVVGTGEPYQAVRVRDITEPGSPLIGQGVIQTDGTWRVDVSPVLVGGHVIYALTNTSSDSATVVQSTPTPFLRPHMDIVTPSTACGPQNTNINFTVSGGNWPISSTVAFGWDGLDSTARAKTGYAYAVPDGDGNFASSFTVNATYVTSGTHTLYATMLYSPYYQDSKGYFVPCEGAPTPTPTSTPILPPDLLVQSLDVSPNGVITSTDSITITTVILNDSANQINELFWVDMYVNPSPAPPGVRQPGTEWKALNSLGPNSTTTLTFHYSFLETGTHNIYIQADSFDYISESNENNNLAGPVTVDYQGAVPSPTPVPPTPTEYGSISGATWIWLGGQWTVPQERVDVYLYQGEDLIATTISAENGTYRFDVVPPGTGYTVIGESVVNNKPYSDTRSGIQVLNGQETTSINLYLAPLY